MSSHGKTLVLVLLATVTAGVLYVVLGGGVGASAATRSAGLVGPQPGADDLSTAAAEERPEDQTSGEPEGRTEVHVPQAPGASTLLATTWEEGFDGQAIYGTVEDDQAIPIAGARVALFPKEGSYDELGAPLQECLANEDGRFRFQELEVFTGFRVYVEADGYLPTVRSMSTGVDDEIALTPSAPFAGRVLDAASGSPIEGVAVWINNMLRTEDGLVTRIESVTDAEGRYAISHARIDKMQSVSIRRAGHMVESREFQVQEGRAEGYDIHLGVGLPLVAYLYDAETGEAVANTEVRLFSGGEAVTDEQGLVRLTTPEHGRLQEGRIYFDVRIDGWCRTTRNVTVPKDGLHEPVELALVRGATITGRVHDAEDAPIEGASVWVSNRNRQPPNLNLPSGTRIRAQSSSPKTDETGRFELTGVLPGTREIKAYASHADYARKESEPLSLVTSQHSAEVEIELTQGALVQGRITLNGEAVRARLWWRGGKSSGSGECNDSGAYRMRGVEPGQIKVTCSVAEGFWTDDEHVEPMWIEDGQINERDIAMVKSRATIAGLVKDAGGTPLSGIQVNAWAEDEGRGDWYFAEGKTDAEGRYELAVTDSPGILYTVSAYQGQRNASRQDVPVGAQNADITLPRTGKVRLEVVDLVSREHVQRFNIYWRERDTGAAFQSLSQGGRAFSPGPEGFFEAELPIGNVDLRVGARSQGYLPADLPNLMVFEDQVSQTALVELTQGVTVEFRFVAQTPGVRNPRVTVVTEDQAEELKSGRWSAYSNQEIYSPQRMRPDAQGKATLKAMAPGTYSFWKPPKNHVFEPKTFEVPHVDHHVVEIQWRIEEKKKEEKPKGDGTLPGSLEQLGYGG